MYLSILIIGVIGVIIGVGTILLLLNTNDKPSKLINTVLEKNMDSFKERRVFVDTHYNITKYQYECTRAIITVTVLAIGIVNVNRLIVLCAIFFYIALFPKENFGRVRLPFGFVYSVFKKKDRELKDDELYQALSLLKNMMVQMRNNPKGADYIISYLADTLVLTRPAFLKLLNLIRLGKDDIAAKVFVDEINTNLAADTARILMQLDKLDPIMLEQNLISIQNEIVEIENTHKQTKNEIYSDLILIPIIATLVVIFYNFIIVAYIGELVQLNYFFN